MCKRLSYDGKTHPGCTTPSCVDGLVSFFRYNTVIRSAIKAMKYRLVSDAVTEFTEMIPKTSYNFIYDYISLANAVIQPVPLHPKRLRERGFNQAELLSRQLGMRLQIPVRMNFLKRIRYTQPQASLKDRRDRLKNMNDVFSSDHIPMEKTGMTVILVDDVFTTGATMRSAAAILKKAGVPSVWALTMAR
jgi:ComF family protein